MKRIEGFGSLPYMGITGTHTIINRVSYFKMNNILLLYGFITYYIEPFCMYFIFKIAQKQDSALKVIFQSNNPIY